MLPHYWNNCYYSRHYFIISYCYCLFQIALWAPNYISVARRRFSSYWHFWDYHLTLIDQRTSPLATYQSWEAEFWRAWRHFFTLHGASCSIVCAWRQQAFWWTPSRPLSIDQLARQLWNSCENFPFLSYKNWLYPMHIVLKKSLGRYTYFLDCFVELKGCSCDAWATKWWTSFG